MPNLKAYTDTMAFDIARLVLLLLTIPLIGHVSGSNL